ncbi:uncharacterized protein L3040_009530 [Drepanopeziza brunnea f. sp. 'multigermtubi']|uniref:Rad17 cell cycle checkpoint protein n=2 Tax=Drepanopeziza brunnea f. sp. 'multigermtubi' TaxID=698441 RepID=K1WUX2_MARBU|nr:Rad17 cell cycle checkpoint protein [Drepanopeziza brunnea f. sp. 'multigermtubi' MB_m1]EKD16232.1 Rad17 cell cycle checkpoint protein [Drepanopeziza brunnea f. sp. 'multigermtubi' MB_m1]KAJ5032943.1 hypothetical protein L3040_009530 [Drepanopeziza brunnea f. sp. 'multigermtubi']
MAPPTKRRKRNVVPSSDEQDDEDEPVTKLGARPSNLVSSSPPSSNDANPPTAGKALTRTAAPSKKMQPRAKTANHPPNAAPVHLPKQVRGAKTSTKSASSSPEKAKWKGLVDDKVKSGNIHTFFTKQAQRQQAEGTIGTVSRPKVAVRSSNSSRHEEDDDLISDDDVIESKAPTSSMVGLAARKRARGVELQNNGDGDFFSASQKFLVPKPPLEIQPEEDTRPWAERFAPANLEDLAVHRKKVSDVRAWLEGVMGGRMRQRLLILKGAAGTGKTTTVHLLAKDMNCGVLEWRNPVGSVASSDGYLSMSAQFEEFMGRGGKFGQLDIFSTDGQVAPKPEIKPLDRRKNLILIEEFPNTFSRSSTALQSFRSTIVTYLASNTPPLSMMNYNSKDPITPVVMIISETLLTTTSASADSFTVHRLLGPEILQHPGVGVIEFNAIAPTILVKALELVVQKESRKSGRRTTPGPLVLKKIGEVGDIRSAIGSLEFLCLRGDLDGQWGAKVAFGKTKKASKETPLTTMEAESLELVTRREASLGIFHAVGKVVHNKREEAPPVLSAGEQDVECLPDFMSMHSRPKRTQVMVDELIDETGTDTQTFVAALHENYILSCEAPPTSFEFSSLDHVNGCIDALSNSDLLCPSWDGTFNSTGFGGGVGGGDILRQDEISFQIAVRGILFALPSPVKRTAPTAAGLRTGKYGEAYRMFYPTSLKLWRMKEEIESTIDLWVSKLIKGEDGMLRDVTAGAAAFARPKIGTVESWKSARPPPSSISKSSKGSGKEADIAPLMYFGTSARKEMLLERLPYMVTIARSKKSSWSTLAICDMEKVTTFRGIGAPSDEDPDDAEDEGALGEEWATDKPGEGKSPRKRGLVFRGKGAGDGLPVQQPKQKLVLSDDDIEDG